MFVVWGMMRKLLRGLALASGLILSAVAFADSVLAQGITMSPSAPALPPATATIPYSQSFTTVGGTAPYAYSLTAGALPAGLTLSSGGIFSGTPTASGSYNFAIRVQDALSLNSTQSYTLVVNAPGIIISPSSLPDPTSGQAYSRQLSASGGNGSYTFAVTTGALPPGISLTTSGLLSGVPTTAASFAFTVTRDRQSRCHWQSSLHTHDLCCGDAGDARGQPEAARHATHGNAGGFAELRHRDLRRHRHRGQRRIQRRRRPVHDAGRRGCAVQFLRRSGQRDAENRNARN